MTYGLPYKGSKNRIAEKIISVLPSADYFIDLFGGGGQYRIVPPFQGNTNTSFTTS